MDTQSTATGSSPDAGRAQFSRRAMAIIVVALIAVGAIAWLKFQKSPVEPRPAPIPTKTNYQPMVKEHVDKAASLDDEAHKSFEVALAKVIAAHEPRFTTAAKAASGEASKYKTIAVTLYYLAWDQVKKEERTDAYLTGKIGSLIDPVVAAFGRDVGTEMGKLETDLRRNSVQLAVDLAALGPGDPPKPLRIDTEAELNREFTQALRNMGLDAAVAGVALTFDAYAIANSSVAQELMKQLAKISSRTFYKQVARLVAILPWTMIDGPLPIVDIVVVVLTTWTVYEISKIRPKFRHELRVAIQNRLDDVRYTMNRQATVFAAGKVSKFKELQLAMGSQSAIALSAREARQ